MSEDLREVIKDALAKQSEEEYDYDEIRTVFEMLEELWLIQRNEGLLALEDEVWEVLEKTAGMAVDFDEPEETPFYVRTYPYKYLSGAYRLLVQMILMVVDGTYPDVLEEIAVTRYYTAKYEGAEALKACMVILGVLSIQAGEAPWILTEKLFALMPEGLENRMIEATLAKDAERRACEKEPVVIADSFFTEPASNQSRIIEITDQIILELSDNDVQVLLYEVKDDDLYNSLTAMSGSARKKAFDNMSAWMADRTYECVRHRLENVKPAVTERADICMLKDLQRLIERGEINPYDGEQVKSLLGEAFAWHEHEVLEHNRKIEAAISDLEWEISRKKRELREIKVWK